MRIKKKKEEWGTREVLSAYGSGGGEGCNSSEI